ncbi:MAG: PAS domain-containing protein [Elusimicrobiota bacterium]|nr:PAS domain-containing protein [Elusimicrobiota bacterium]
MMKVDDLVEAMPVGLCLADPDGSIFYMNPAARDFLSVREGSAPLRSCDIVCGRLYEDGPRPCSETCALLDPKSDATEVAFDGRHGPRKTAIWSDGRMRLSERWAHLRVRCFKIESAFWGLPAAPRRLILIDDRSEEDARARRGARPEGL